jgi:filamentous hemagglutinin
MEEVMSDPQGIDTGLKMNDARWPSNQGWVKMRQNVNGVEVHWVENTITGAVDDFKFK